MSKHTPLPKDEYATEADTAELLQASKLPEPLRLADALEKTMQWPLHGKAADCLRKLHGELEAMKAAQPVQEPVAWMRKDGTLRFADGKMFAVGQPFYTTPPAAAPVQEPGPSGDYLSDFQEGQWWLAELDAAVANGTLAQRVAVAVVRNLLATVAVNTPQPAPVQAAEKQEPVGVVHHKPTFVPGADYEQVAVFTRALEPGTKLYTTPPAAQPAPVQEPVLQEIEQYQLQMAGISTAAIGYWKEGDGIHPDYDTPALRDVAKLYAKYDAIYTAAKRQPLTDEKRRKLMSEAWNKWLSKKDDGRLFAWDFSFEVEAAHGITGEKT